MRGIFKTIALLSIVIFLGCEKDDDIDKDNISIISVTPSSDLEDGVEYNFIVEIEYDLATVSSGILMIGFNTDEINRYVMVSEASYIIEKGTGFHTFDVETIAKDWINAGDYKVYVNLSENPHPQEWSPLASDSESLQFRN